VAGFRDREGIPTVPPPTEQEIRRACERIQATWSEQVRRKRAGTVEKRWTVPEVRVIDEALDDSEEGSTELVFSGERQRGT